MNAPQIYAGIMTGTSLDSACAVLCRASPDDFQPVACAEQPIPESLADKFRSLDEQGALAEAMDAANELTRLCAQAFLSLPREHKVAALGCHGQTVLHNPPRGWTLQLLNGALLAELTKVDIICDFRSRDIAAGGQGAPLAPLFHREFFAKFAPCAVINLGGIANITVLEPGSEEVEVRGWDICPANMLMDAWHRQHKDGAFDQDGEWAKSGKVNDQLLQHLHAHPFLALPPPKSCGKEQFDLRHFADELRPYAPEDAQATLAEWSAQCIAQTINQTTAARAYFCGGGVRNKYLFHRLTDLVKVDIQPTDQVGLMAEQVEAVTFAWLARQFKEQTKLETKKITGGSSRILGALYPAD